MDSTEQINELDKLSHQFTQFIMAVNGALIAYAFKEIEGKQLTLTLIPVALAITFWGLSFYSGVTSLRRINGARLIGVLKNTYIVKNYDNAFEAATDALTKISTEANAYHQRMFSYLYYGVFSYGFWQLLEMYFRTTHK